MVNWKSDMALFHSARALGLVTHALYGVLVWEWLTNLWYDWEIIRGRVTRSVGTFLYLLVRYSSLAGFTVGIRVFNVIHPTNCQPMSLAVGIMLHATVVLASGLLYLRVCAVSSYSKPVVAVYGVFWLGLFGTSLWSGQLGHGVYVPQLFLCAPIGIQDRRYFIIYHFVFDVACLVGALYFLISMHRRSGLTSVGSAGNLWKMLVQQGVVYIAFICMTYLIAVIINLLNLNDAMSQLPQGIAVTATCIGGTRMQRTLTLAMNNGPGIPASARQQPPSYGAQPHFTNNSAIQSNKGVIPSRIELGEMSYDGKNASGWTK